MQTFLPYDDFKKTAACLWYRHLGKQRVECKQIFIALRHGGAWSRHPATRMWRGHAYFLWLYYSAMCFEWVKRGYRHAMQLDDDTIKWAEQQQERPPWLGDARIHYAYQVSLLWKQPEHYTQVFQQEFPGVSPTTLPEPTGYVWPV